MHNSNDAGRIKSCVLESAKLSNKRTNRKINSDNLLRRGIREYQQKGSCFRGRQLITVIQTEQSKKREKAEREHVFLMRRMIRETIKFKYSVKIEDNGRNL